MTCEHCGKVVNKLTRKLCGACYQRLLKNGSPNKVKVRNRCTVPGCDKFVNGHGLCSTHYSRQRLHGHIESTRPKTWGTIEKHPLLHVWRNMTRTKHSKKRNICPQWENDFLQFVNDIGEKPSKSHKLKLIDEHIGYYPGNVIWEETHISVEKFSDTADYHKQYAREYRKKRPLNYKNSELKKYFNITIDQYHEMFELQGGKCKICGIDATELTRSLAVDHCHATGKIRGLLCPKCNQGLGHFKDSKELLQKAIQYLIE